MKSLSCLMPDIQLQNPEQLGECLSFRVYSGPRPIAHARLRAREARSVADIGTRPSYSLKIIEVSQNYRHQGVGSALLDEVIDFCRAQNVQSLHGEALGDHAHLKQWYEERGFVLDDHSKMHLDLDKE